MVAPIILLSQKQLQLKTVDVDSITTADDTFVTLYPVTHATTPSARRQILNGSGSGGGCLLADATTFALYDEFEIFNNSSEVQIIKNSDLTLFEFLVPRATAIIKCTSISTAAGSWEYVDDNESLGFNACSQVSEDWIETSTLANYKMSTAVSGSGTAFARSSALAGSFGGCGYTRTNTSSATASAIFYYGSGYLPLGDGAIYIKSKINLNNLGVNPYELIAWVGISDTFSGVTPLSAPVNSIGVRFKSIAPDASANWILSAWSGSSNTLGTTDQDVAVGLNTWHTIDIVINDDASQVDAYVDNEHISRLTSGIPTGDLQFGFGIEGMGATALNRVLFEDYHKVHQHISGGR